MAKLKLQPEPTFRAKVAIPQAGAEAVEVEFTFKHRDRKALKEFTDTMADREDVDQILAIASGWELEDEFNAENVGALVANYFAAPRAIFWAYIEELTQAKEKN